MTKVASVLGIAAAGVLATACATTTHDAARMEARTTLANAAELSGTDAADVVGKTSIAWGDRFTAANLFERATDDRASVGKRFNLAGAYLVTGREAQAAALYRELVRDGQFTYAYSNRPMDNRNVPVRRFNIADESARRLAQIEARNPAFAPAPASGVLSAESFGTPVSATVGGLPGGRISDERAMALDAATNGG
ncbi:hypothetical protein [Phenylobacterium sp. J367]|uniref:hypothetical protein n=1 Tax=Phenylobacterium sp. J367 TaxID=2898435 RepID=UPI002151D3CA|nr:hypothetical protein [Phenylobacterium sp. J367]MCR5879528.1 hypothetical protein [Phenylobacterium sp. J367]